MEITINLPEQIFASISSVASKSHKRVDEVIVEKIEGYFSVDVEELAKQISYCSDDEVLELPQSELAAEQRISRHLSGPGVYLS